MLREVDLKTLVELRNELADIGDRHANDWPEMRQLLFLAELLVQREIVSFAASESHAYKTAEALH